MKNKVKFTMVKWLIAGVSVTTSGCVWNRIFNWNDPLFPVLSHTYQGHQVYYLGQNFLIDFIHFANTDWSIGDLLIIIGLTIVCLLALYWAYWFLITRHRDPPK